MTKSKEELPSAAALATNIQPASFGVSAAELLRVLENAERLMDDAAFLAAGGRLKGARSLAILSYEEVGKLILKGWREQGLTPPPIQRRNEHHRKQLAVAAVIAASWWRARTGEIAADTDLAEFKRSKGVEFARSAELGRLEHAFDGEMDLQKQAGFYVDLGEAAAATVKEPSASEILSLLADGWMAATLLQDPHTLDAAAHIVEVMPDRPPSRRRRRPSV